jgi:ribosomal protein S1
MSVVYASASLVILQTGDQRAVLYRDDTKNRELARTELKINAKLQVYVLYEDKNTTNCIVGLKPPDPSDLWECLHSPGASLAGTKKRATVDYIEVDFKKSTTGRIGRNEFLSLEEFNSIARLPHGSPIDCRILGVYGRKTKKLILGLPAKGPCSE